MLNTDSSKPIDIEDALLTFIDDGKCLVEGNDNYKKFIFNNTLDNFDLFNAIERLKKKLKIWNFQYNQNSIQVIDNYDYINKLFMSCNIKKSSKYEYLTIYSKNDGDNIKFIALKNDKDKILYISTELYLVGIHNIYDPLDNDQLSILINKITKLDNYEVRNILDSTIYNIRGDNTPYMQVTRIL